MDKSRVTEIEQAAAETLISFGFYSDETPVDYLDVVLIARSHGFSVYNGGLPANRDGFVVIQAGPVMIHGEKVDGRVIAVNRDRGGPFKRFLVAHELGHYIHYESGEKTTDDVEADYFAAALLMPKEMFVRDYQQLENLEDRFLNLAREYRVRVSDARFRAEMLGLK